MRRIFSKAPTWRSTLLTIIWLLLLVLFGLIAWLILTTKIAAQDWRMPQPQQIPAWQMSCVATSRVVMSHIEPAWISPWGLVPGRLVPGHIVFGYIEPGGIRPGHLDPGGLRGLRPHTPGRLSGLAPLPGLRPLQPISPIRALRYGYHRK